MGKAASSTARSAMSPPTSPFLKRRRSCGAACCGRLARAAAMTMIHNPVLPGFNPDPSICRAGDDYYVATSTFEWVPGVQIHHSRDLVNWRLVRRPLDRAAQLDLRGEPDSCGVWAPCLSFADGKFWLDGDFKDAHNYISRRKSRAPGPIRPMSIRAVSTHRSSTTTTDANGSSTWSGTTATRPAPI